MSFKKIICLIFCTLMMLSSVGCQPADDNTTIIGPEDYTSKLIIPRYDPKQRMEIFAFFAPDFRFAYTQERFDEVAEAGFTLILSHNINFGTSSQNVINGNRQKLTYAHNANLKVFIMDDYVIKPTWRDAPIVDPDGIPDFTNSKYYKDHPAFYGIWMEDESPREYWSYLGGKMQLCKEEFPGKMMGTNTCVLQNDYVSQLHEYVSTVQPTMLSFDQYPLVSNTIRPQWLSNVAITRHVARQYGLISGCWIQMTGGYWDLRLTTEADMRWQIAVCMAYGYDMIEEYSYSGFDAPAANLPEAHSEKLFDDNGERTDLYYTVKKVNNEVHNWGHIYNAFDWYGTAIYRGTPGYNKMIEAIDPDFQLKLAQVSGIESITSNQDLLVGAFVDKDLNDGIMITNLGYCNDPNQAAEVTVKFENKYVGVMVCGKDFDKDNPKIVVLQNGAATIDLEAGEGKFLIPLKWK